MWKMFKAGDETEAIADGVATTLIRIGAAALVEEIKDDNTTKPAHDGDKQADSSDGADIGASDADGSKTAIVSGGVGHKPGRRTR
jgi:hypothetical protein